MHGAVVYVSPFSLQYLSARSISEIYKTKDCSVKPILLDTTLKRRDRMPASVFANLQTGSFAATSSVMVPCYGPSNYFG